jgi:hypothetical protein
VAVVAAASPSPFLVEALRAMPDVVDLDRTVLARPDAEPAAFAEVDVVVADGVEPPEGRPALVFAAPGRVVERPLLWGVGRHPVLEGADLAPLRIERAALLSPAEGETAIVASASGAVGVAGERDGVRRVTLGFAPDASTLPLEAAFPVLVRNALAWVAAPARAPRFVVAGEPVPGGDGEVVALPQPAGPRALWLPGGAVTAVRWKRPQEFRLSRGETAAGPSAMEAIAALPDRRAQAPQRRYAPWLAAAGSGLLVVGAMFLRRAPHAAQSAAPPPRLVAVS